LISFKREKKPLEMIKLKFGHHNPFCGDSKICSEFLGIEDCFSEM